MFDFRSKSEMQLLRNNRHEDTMKLQVWQKRAQLIIREMSEVKWTPSVHLLENNYILHIVGGQKNKQPTEEEALKADAKPTESGDMIDFVLRSGTYPY